MEIIKTQTKNIVRFSFRNLNVLQNRIEIDEEKGRIYVSSFGKKIDEKHRFGEIFIYIKEKNRNLLYKTSIKRWTKTYQDQFHTELRSKKYVLHITLTTNDLQIELVKRKDEFSNI